GSGSGHHDSSRADRSANLERVAGVGGASYDQLMRTQLARTLGLEFPIFAFSHCRDVVAAVSRAGGMGVLGALYFTPEELEIELNWIDEHVDGKPYGVDVVMPMKYMGKGGGDEANFANLDAMIPQEHRDFVDELLRKHD